MHQKRASITAGEKLGYSELASMRPEGMDEQTARRRLRYQQWGRRKGLQEIAAMKATFDRAWRSADFKTIASCSVWFDGRLNVASTGMVSPDYTVDGEQLQELHLPGMQSLAFGTVATPNGGAVVFTWPKDMRLMTRS